MFEHDNKRRSDDLPFVECIYGAIVGLILALVLVYGLSQWGLIMSKFTVEFFVMLFAVSVSVTAFFCVLIWLLGWLYSTNN
jgi:uncharacterized membrane protein YdbT with pleckstrin-like domain